MTDFYTKLGTHPIINAAGNTTSFGGSTPSPAVKAAMAEADKGSARHVMLGNGVDISPNHGYAL